MSVLGIDEAVVARSVQAVLPGSLREQGADSVLRAEIFARAAWSGIVEPGDGIAGNVIAALGPVSALAAVIGRWEHRLLLERFDREGAAELAEVAPAAEWAQALQRWQPRLSAQRALAGLEHAARLGVCLLTPEMTSLSAPATELWPEGLADLGRHAPVALWMLGCPQALAALPRSLALVGARAATGYGEKVAVDAADGLARRGFAVVSGAAYGIDGMAHRSALAAEGTTVAFLAGGVDRFYPSGHDQLLHQIAERGAVLAELPCGQSPTRWRFLHRNRLIAAVTRATVVIEAGHRSGSLNTAGHAAALGRPLGAVPGPITSPSSRGCHRLIRDYGAVCVTDAAEMAELAGFLEERSPDALLSGAVDRGPRSAEEAQASTDASGRASARGQENSRSIPEGDGGLSSPQGENSATPAAGRSDDPRQWRVIDALSTRTPRSTGELAASSGLAVAEVQQVLAVLSLESRAVLRSTGWLRTRGLVR